jgi:phosphotriesterase-related protein
MSNITRREFVAMAALPLFSAMPRPSGTIVTVNGPIRSDELGKSLIHEHILVDFIGADKINPSRWDHAVVEKKVLPYLLECKKLGVKSFFDCTPSFLGKDPALLKRMSDKSGLHIITNTGYYGAVQNKYLPPWALTESAEQLATRWTEEFENGMDGTTIKPGFIKIGVDSGPLSDVHKKLVRAAALTHLRTGLTICSHTGPAEPAFEELEILKETGVHPNAFVWVHAQNEKNKSNHVRAARAGAWVSLDGIGARDYDNYVDSIMKLESAHLLSRTLISHDAGWYSPDDPNGTFQSYTGIFKEIIPRLKKKGLNNAELKELMFDNPANAFSIGVKRL